MSVCIKCGASLTNLDISLHKKLINRGANSYMCKKCLSEHMKLSEKELDELAERFRQMGCTLFL